MEVKEALLKRRSVRKFKEDKICEEIINELLIAAMSGPSACNKKPWEFYVVTNEEIFSVLNVFGSSNSTHNIFIIMVTL